ncbi:MAG: hypothetical protein CMJ77_09170 [Planctomycetaceae bacterium]|nr:hypothetical protein [Planctomycetaceae bacterium]
MEKVSMLLPGTVGCRHLQVDWIDSTRCFCRNCGKTGHWKEGMVIWQRRRPRNPPETVVSSGVKSGVVLKAG